MMRVGIDMGAREIMDALAGHVSHPQESSSPSRRYSSLLFSLTSEACVLSPLPSIDEREAHDSWRGYEGVIDTTTDLITVIVIFVGYSRGVECIPKRRLNGAHQEGM